MQILGTAARKQAAMSAPLVPIPILTARHAVVSAVLRTPSAAVQRGTRGSRATPVTPSNAEQACGRSRRQASGGVVGTQLLVEGAVEDVPPLLLVGEAVLEPPEPLVGS